MAHSVDGLRRRSLHGARRLHGNAHSFFVERLLKQIALDALHADIQDVRDRIVRGINADGRICAERPPEPCVQLADTARSLLIVADSLRKRLLKRCGAREVRRAAPVHRRADAAVNLRLENHTLSLIEDSASEQTVKLVRRKAQCIDPIEKKRRLSDRLRRVHMKPRPREVLQNLRDLADGLLRPELAVHSRHGNEDRVLPEKASQLLEVDLPVSPHGNEINLPALVLQRRERPAKRRVLERRRDDVPSLVPLRVGKSLYSEVVRLTRAGRIDQLLRKDSLASFICRCELCGDPFRHARHLPGCFPSRRMCGVRIAWEMKRRICIYLQNSRINRRICRIVKINHV